jgi:hypothetical protein
MPDIETSSGVVKFSCIWSSFKTPSGMLVNQLNSIFLLSYSGAASTSIEIIEP